MALEPRAFHRSKGERVGPSGSTLSEFNSGTVRRQATGVGARQDHGCGVSSTACVSSLDVVASHRIWPESLMASAMIIVNPEPAGIKVLRVVKGPFTETTPTC